DILSARSDSFPRRSSKAGGNPKPAAPHGRNVMTDNIDTSDDSPPGRRTFLKTAATVGAAGALAAPLADPMHGKYALAPISTAQAQPAMPKLSDVEMGRAGRGRREQPHDAAEGARDREMDPRRQGLQARARL